MAECSKCKNSEMCVDCLDAISKRIEDLRHEMFVLSNDWCDMKLDMRDIVDPEALKKHTDKMDDIRARIRAINDELRVLDPESFEGLDEPWDFRAAEAKIIY